MSNLVYDHVFSPVVIKKLPSTALSLSVSTHCNWQLVMTIHDDDDVWWQLNQTKLLKICRWRFLQPCKNWTNHVCAFQSDKIFYEQLYYIQTFGTQVLRNIIYKNSFFSILKNILFILLSSFPKLPGHFLFLKSRAFYLSTNPLNKK